jgi:SAP domain.
MKLVTYIGRCKSLTKHGHKFTEAKKTAIMNDEIASNFENFDDFTISNIAEQEIVPDTKSSEVKNEVTDNITETVNEEVNLLNEEDENKKKKLMRLNVDILKEMCNNSGLDTEGKKEDLVQRLLTPKE